MERAAIGEAAGGQAVVDEPRGQPMVTAASVRIKQDLNDLRLLWDDVYKIDYCRGEAEPWRAERLDDHQVLTHATAIGLRDQMINDHGNRHAGPDAAVRCEQ